MKGLATLLEALIGLGIFTGYFVLLASVLVLLKWLLKPPGELFRKLLHLVVVMSIFVLLYAVDEWYLAVFVPLAFALLVYPALAFLERYPKIMFGLLRQRQNGEIKTSLVVVCLMMAILVTVFWGWLGEGWKFTILVAVLGWGFGDAAAALVGKAVGRRPVVHRWVDEGKTLEGTTAMFVVSAVAILVTLLAFSPFSWPVSLLVALVIAPLCAAVELFSRRGFDTITVPLATAAATFLLIQLLTTAGVIT